MSSTTKPSTTKPSTTKPSTTVRTALLALTLAVATTACAAKSTVSTVEGPTVTTMSATGAPDATAAKPQVTVPDGPPPTALTSRDLIVGDGAEAVAGKQVSVQYVGVSYSTKMQFDASWDRGQAFDFPLGGDRVIDGWDQGVVGMKVGGRRELIIPPALGYGDRGAGADIKPGETLVFVIDLLKVS